MRHVFGLSSRGSSATALPISAFLSGLVWVMGNVKARAEEVFLYLNASRRCLEVACETGMANVCKSLH